jgi:hypothetical protein
MREQVREMGGSQADDDLGLARAEIRQLRATIDALRAELEESEAKRFADRQRAAAEQEADRERARESIDAMRARLEISVVEQNAAVQSALAHASDEVAQLKAMVEVLRSSLTAAREDAAAFRDAGERTFRAEREELHETIAVLRGRLETLDAG